MDDILNLTYWGNTISNYLVALGGILLAWIVLRLVKGPLFRFIKNLTKKTNTSIDDSIIWGAERFILPYLFFAAIYHIINQLTLTKEITNVLANAMLFITAWYAIRLINTLLHSAVLAYMKQKNEPPERSKQLNGILLVVKIIIWVIGIVVVIDNLGYNVTTIVAGLGVGGIAVALAAQNILGDLFSYLVIFFDKPFEVGDFIYTNNYYGTVEKIGIKTSHIRSLDGQLMIMPNAEMTKSIIHNYKSMVRRRVVFSFGVAYATPAAQLKMIPGYLREIIATQNQATFDRAHFKSFSESSLAYEVAYYMEDPDYTLYMDTHQAVCIRLFEVFERENIQFAFPSRTVFLHTEASALAN